MSANLVIRVIAVMVAVMAVTACHSGNTSGDGYPGLAIEARCRTGSMTAQYVEIAPAYPGERVSGTLLEPRYLGGSGELPLPCIDHDRRPETYRIRHGDAGEFSALVLIVGVSRSTIGARLWVTEQRSDPWGIKTRRGKRALSDAEWHRVVAPVAQIHFWIQPALLLPERTPAVSSEWRDMLNLEGYKGNRYHGVSRVDNDDNVSAVAHALIDLSRPLLDTVK
jgi:hypothetical protein